MGAPIIVGDSPIHNPSVHILEVPRDWRFLGSTKYFGSFNLSCDPVLARWAALLPTAIKTTSYTDL